MLDKKMLPDTLPGLRDRIDEIDQKIQQLINERALCAQKVADVKVAEQGEEGVVFYRPEREAQVLRRVMERNEGPLGNEEMAKVFRQIMSSCLALEKPMRIAFLGPEGTFTQQAAHKHFGKSIVSAPMAAIDEVFREVESGAANYGVVPVENSTEGVVNHTLDSFRSSHLKICGEVEERIHHHLLISPNINAEDVTHIYSHQQALAQCRAWLDRYWPHVERVSVSSNAEAARLVSEAGRNGKAVAAIAGEIACELYGLQKESSNIEDHPENTTRFLIIGNQDVPASGSDKTSLLISAKNEPGALYRLLEAFERHRVDMTRLETRPSLISKWGYIFYIDCVGHYSDASCKAVISELRERASEVKVLGSYPVAVL
ncbi:prephenate dehydratase [Marinomonas mediterranea]|jgi:chorismate mutase domain of proteobacterial P-protein, clade 2|uniref:Bifunctional chorismate mutase/prephenate dehydratase n=1 Tax=Marinomonas mediterranea (strain ATCC 700492 / JCM 21426 / NBRC 103028 / MMB-1) TaxID=717774 RepID=F2JXC6_MARM1|nr:prephenate dehydratase [Marinomonas mediterranea]ADZ90732.1 chorismate mutase [Marinomonas mediterranea MMB-1]WCN12824.1 prephenate dehydratase [Marinomonas mediterranea]WCN16891.1 prephenate dehydratase [Marinomonas mediterranea MMB-1]